ncbi:MAG: SecDF P1 head subdomain-containing protein [Wujia sp.]
MKKFKLILLLVFSLCLSLVIVGCGDSADDKDKTDKTDKTVRIYKICSEESISDDEMKQITRILNERALNYTDKAEIKAGEDNTTIRIYIPDLNSDIEDEIYERLTSRGELQMIEHYGEENERVVITNGDIAYATAALDESNFRADYVVQIKMTKDGKDKFAEATEANIGNTIAIVYDGEVVSAPTVTNAITEGVCVINNLGSMEEAQDLAMYIQGGALPYELELATVGKDSDIKR